MLRPTRRGVAHWSCYNQKESTGVIRCPSTNTFATTAKPSSKKSSSTSSKKSPAPSAPAKKPRSSCLFSRRLATAALPHPPAAPQAVEAVAAAAVAAATSEWHSQSWLCAFDSLFLSLHSRQHVHHHRRATRKTSRLRPNRSQSSPRHVCCRASRRHHRRTLRNRRAESFGYDL